MARTHKQLVPLLTFVALVVGAGPVRQTFAAPAGNGRYVVSATAKTVYDKVTGLTWQREPTTTGGNGTGLFQWAAAKTWCMDLVLGGQSNWRLPSIVELRSLVQRNNTTSPAINSVAFPYAQVSGTSDYWSATPEPGGSNAWLVDFYGGTSARAQITGQFADRAVRCVR